ncbi:hypothetical protein [Bradyrhizobium sp.]
MNRYFTATILAIVGLWSGGRDALAQDVAQPTYVVTYIEITPGLASGARQLILAYSAQMRERLPVPHKSKRSSASGIPTTLP